jgi:hypothetical protein
MDPIVQLRLAVTAASERLKQAMNERPPQPLEIVVFKVLGSKICRADQSEPPDLARRERPTRPSSGNEVPPWFMGVLVFL